MECAGSARAGAAARGCAGGPGRRPPPGAREPAVPPTRPETLPPGAMPPAAARDRPGKFAPPPSTQICVLGYRQEICISLSPGHCFFGDLCDDRDVQPTIYDVPRTQLH